MKKSEIRTVFHTLMGIAALGVIGTMLLAANIKTDILSENAEGLTVVLLAGFWGFTFWACGVWRKKFDDDKEKEVDLLVEP